MVPFPDTLKQCIEDFITEDLSGSINKLSAVIDIEELKQTVTIAKELRENIAMIESFTQAELYSTELEAEKIKQGQLAQQLETALLTVQEQIFENYAQLETVFDTSMLQKVTDVTVSLQSNLSTAVASIATEMDQTMASDQIETLTEMSLSEEQAVVATTENEHKQLAKNDMTTDSTPQELAVDESIEKITTEEIQPIKPQEIIENKAMATAVEELKIATVTEAIKSETLKQSIEDFISDNFNETINNLSSVIDIDQLKTSINLAQELHENIAPAEKNIVLLHTTEDLGSEKLKQGKLVQELQTALLTVQEQIFDNYQQLEGICDSSKLQKLADITVTLQTQLAAAITISFEEKEKSFDSDSTVVPSTSSIEAVVEADIIEKEMVASISEIKPPLTEEVRPAKKDTTEIITDIAAVVDVKSLEGMAEIKNFKIEENVTKDIQMTETAEPIVRETTVGEYFRFLHCLS